MSFEHLTRDLTQGSGSAGGVLTSTDTELLRLPLVGAGVVRAGANVILNAKQNTTIPHVNTKPTFAWQSSESSQLGNDNTLLLGQTTASFKRGGINVRVTRQLRSQTDLDSVLSRLLTQVTNDALDLAALNGSGAAGQPLGLLSTAGVQSVSGTNLNLPGLSSMEEMYSHR